jgi:hypothetical protein
MFWNSMIILMLGYTATYMPFEICFIDENIIGKLIYSLIYF